MLQLAKAQFCDTIEQQAYIILEYKGGELKILLVTADKFPPFRVDVSVLFGMEMSRRDYDIDWIMQAENDRRRSGIERWGRWRVYVGATNNGSRLHQRLHKQLLAFLNDLRALRLGWRGNYEVIQVKDRFLGALGALAAARISGSPFVYWLSYPFAEASTHEAKVGTARYPLLYRIRGRVFSFILYRMIGPSADHMFVQSDQMKEDLCEMGLAGDKMTVVPMGYSPMLLGERGSVPRAVDPNAVVYLGTLLQTRQLDFLVRVLSRVRAEIPQARLYMVGPEELPGDIDILEREAARLGVSDGLIITGRLERKDALEYVRHAGVCVSPFYPTPILRSTSPTKLIEYMALGRPVVANDHPEQRQLIADSAGGYCVPYCESAFATAIVDLMKDRAQADRMGRNGHAYVALHRDYKRIADTLDNRYRSIARGSPIAAS